MKAWFNKKGNWCFELEKEEGEVERFIMLVSSGVYDGYRKTYWENPKEQIHLRAYLSAKFFNYLLQVIFIGQNYSQSHPTVRNPMHVTAKDAIRSAIENYNKEYTEEEVKFIKSVKDPRDIL